MAADSIQRRRRALVWAAAGAIAVVVLRPEPAPSLVHSHSLLGCVVRPASGLLSVGPCVRPQLSHSRLAALPSLTEEEMAAIVAWEERDGTLSDTATDAMVRGSSFPIAPEDLILRAKLYLASNQYSVTKPDMLDEDFVFVGNIIGPLDKPTFIKQLNGFSLPAAFPDAKGNNYHFRVDPYEPSRVWFTARVNGTNTGSLPPLIPEPTNVAFQSPPEICSLRFNEQGKVVELTAAYIMDRRQGNTGGRGGLIGILYAIGKPLPYPESYPYEPSWQRSLFEKLVSVAESVANR